MVKITKKDIGRTVVTKNGCLEEIIRFRSGELYPVETIIGNFYTATGINDLFDKAVTGEYDLDRFVTVEPAELYLDIVKMGVKKGLL